LIAKSIDELQKLIAETPCNDLLVYEVRWTLDTKKSIPFAEPT
jgi:hypothetical protein